MELDAENENPLPHADGDPDQNSAPASPDDPKPGHDGGETYMGLEDGYTLVKIGHRTCKAKNYFSQLKTPKKRNAEKTDNGETLQKYTGNTPLPPPELYHGKGAVILQTVVGESIYFYKIKIHQDLRSTDAGQSLVK